MILFEIPSWLTGLNLIIGLFVGMTTLAGVWAIYTVRKGGEISTLQTDRATAAEGLVKIRDVQLSTAEERIAELEEELEAVTAEHRTLTGIKITELIEFSARRDEIEAEIQDLKKEIRILHKRKDGDV